MRRTISTLILAAALAVAGCGDDEPEQAEVPRPAPTQRARPDTAAADTARANTRPGDQAGQPAEPRGAGDASGVAAPAGERTAEGAAAAPAVRGTPPGDPAGAGQRLYTVQVAAFTSADSAQKWTGRLSSLDLPVWMSMTEQGGTTYYRVRVGAVRSFSDARRLGALMTDRFEWPVWIAPVTAADRPPEDAVPATRRVLGGG